jgi:hypothetical protein
MCIYIIVAYFAIYTRITSIEAKTKKIKIFVACEINILYCIGVGAMKHRQKQRAKQ